MWQVKSIPNGKYMFDVVVEGMTVGDSAPSIRTTDMAHVYDAYDCLVTDWKAEELIRAYEESCKKIGYGNDEPVEVYGDGNRIPAGVNIRSALARVAIWIEDGDAFIGWLKIVGEDLSGVVVTPRHYVVTGMLEYDDWMDVHWGAHDDAAPTMIDVESDYNVICSLGHKEIVVRFGGVWELMMGREYMLPHAVMMEYGEIVAWGLPVLIGSDAEEANNN